MPENRYAILIANQDYPEDSGFAPLKCPLNDAQALRDVLNDPNHGDFAEVRILADMGRRDILVNLSEFLGRAKKDDLVFIYFSGHGKLSARGDLFLAAQNTRADNLLATGISARDVNELMHDSFVRKKALVLDCCYAGAFRNNFQNTRGGFQEKLDHFSRSSGTYVLMATDELSLAEEDPDTGYGVFTKHMVDGLRGAADANRDGIITLTELSNYVHARVVESHNQVPMEAGLDKRDEIAISKSGIEPDKELRARIKARLLDWAQADDIPSTVLTPALAILEKGLDLGARDQGFRAVLNKIIEEDLKPAHFVFQWSHKKLTDESAGFAERPDAQDPPPETKPAGGGEKPKPPRDRAKADALWEEQVLFGGQTTSRVAAAAPAQQQQLTLGISAVILLIILCAVIDLGAVIFVAAVLGMPDTMAWIAGVPAVLVGWLLGFLRHRKSFVPNVLARLLLGAGALASMGWALLLVAVSFGLIT